MHSKLCGYSSPFCSVEFILMPLCIYWMGLRCYVFRLSVCACVHACMPRWEHSWVGLPLSSSYVIGLVFIKFMYLPCFYFTATGVRSDLLFSRPRSDGWSHHGRTFSIYPYPLSF